MKIKGRRSKVRVKSVYIKIFYYFFLKDNMRKSVQFLLVVERERCDRGLVMLNNKGGEI